MIFHQTKRDCKNPLYLQVIKLLFEKHRGKIKSPKESALKELHFLQALYIFADNKKKP